MRGSRHSLSPADVLPVDLPQRECLWFETRRQIFESANAMLSPKAFTVYESLYMCFSANTLPHFFGVIKFFFRSWLSEKWKMPLTPHSLGLHKLLGLFSPAVRPIINRSVTRCFCSDCGVFHFPSKYKRSEDCFMILFHRGSRKRLRSAVNIADLRCN